jgi:hypothetical protein
MVEIWTFRYFGVVSLKRSLGVELRIPTIKHYSNYLATGIPTQLLDFLAMRDYQYKYGKHLSIKIISHEHNK